MSGSICRQLAAGYLGVSAKTSAAWSLRLSSPSGASSSLAPAAAAGLTSLCGLQTGLADAFFSGRQYSTGSKPKAKEAKEAAKPKKAKTTGYSMFLKDAWSEIKEKQGGMAFKEASSILSERWANLPDSAKEKYRAQAVQYNKDFHPVAKEPVKRKKTAYNVFISDRFLELKASNPTLKAPQIMTKAAAEWKVLDENVRDSYKKKAAAANE